MKQNAYIILRDYDTKFGSALEVLHHNHQMTFLQSPKELPQAIHHYGFKSLKAAEYRAHAYPGNKRAMYILGPNNKKYKLPRLNNKVALRHSF